MAVEEKNMIFKVEGFEVEYNLTSSKIAVEDLDSIELGSSIYEIRDKLGEPDSWIGCGMLRPVYFLEGNKVAVFHFKYPAACDGLNQIVLIDQSGNTQIIKEGGEDYIYEDIYFHGGYRHYCHIGLRFTYQCNLGMYDRNDRNLYKI